MTAYVRCYLIAPIVVLVTYAGPAHAQATQPKPTVVVDDYAKWEELRGDQISQDGKWLAWNVQSVGGDGELRLRSSQAGERYAYAEGRAPAFSADGMWFAWINGLSQEEKKKQAKEAKGGGKSSGQEDATRESVGLRNLGSGEEQTFEGADRHAFDATGKFQARLTGSSLVVANLATGESMMFGDVADFAWCDVGTRIAFTIQTDSGDANGVQVFDAATGRLRGLDTSSSAYSALAWRKDASDLALLRSVQPAKSKHGEKADQKKGKRKQDKAHSILAWRDLTLDQPTRLVLDPTAHEAIGAEFEITTGGPPRWSDDGLRIAFGIRPVEPPEQDEETTEGDAKPTEDPPTPSDIPEQPQEADAKESKSPDDDELPGVQIWHSADRRIYPGQKSAESRDERRTLLSVWNLDANRVVRVGSDLMERVELLGDWTRATERVAGPYKWGAMFGRPYFDLHAIDTTSGERKVIFEKARHTYASPDGRYVMRFDGQDYWTHDLASGADINITTGLDAEFTNTRYDTPTDLTPPHGVGGWLADDSAVFLFDRFDVWRVKPDGAGGQRVTQGAADEVIYRPVDLDFDQPGLDPTAPIYFSLRGELTEQRGYARLDPAESLARRLILADANIGRLRQAEEAEVYVYRREAVADSPDLFVGDGSLDNAVQITATNPFHDDYAWTKSELIDFTSEAGVELQAILLYPANHDPSRRYPMITYTYEILAPRIHSYQAPNEERYYNFSVWTQQGYFVLMPDIVYRPREPGTCAIEAVRPAVATIVERGLVDAKKVGLIGHSWGGYQAAYLPTRIHIFAAAVAGAPLTNFVSFMGQIHWSAGIAEVDHWENGQARMQVPFWEDPEAHRRESPIHEVHNMQTPMLMMFGDDDGSVDWDQGTEFYNYARRAGKQMVLLVYEGEGHGLSKKPNRIDYHRRILEWFGHYLKGDPAPKWITDGIALEDLEVEKRRSAAGGTTR